MSIRITYAALALLFGIVLAFATPPFRPPDEVTHFWRADAIAVGYFVPPMHHGYPSAMIPRGIEQLWYGRDVPLDLQHRVLVHFNANYTPVPYLPQVAACFAGHRLELRPIAILRLGRICNLIAFVALMLVAMRKSPPLALPIAVVGLLPMSLHLAASFSPDAMTIAIATLLTASVASDARAATALSALIAIVKPAYFPIVLMTRRIGAFIACGVMLVVTSLLLRQNFHLDRPGVVLDAGAQLRGIVHAPFTFAWIVISDYVRHVPRYAEGLVGRLGFLDVPLPRVIVILLVMLVVAVALMNDVRFTAKERWLAASSIAVSMLLISTSQYLTWTPVHARYIDGVQGRYFLPLLPLAMAACGGAIKRKLPADVIFALLAIADLSAVLAFTPTPGP